MYLEMRECTGVEQQFQSSNGTKTCKIGNLTKLVAVQNLGGNGQVSVATQGKLPANLNEINSLDAMLF